MIYYLIVDPLVHTIFLASVFLDILFILFQLVVFSICVSLQVCGDEFSTRGYFASPSCCVARCIKATHVGLHGFLGFLFNVGSNEMRWHFVCGIWRRIWCCFIPVALLFEDRVLRLAKHNHFFIQTFEKRGLLLSLPAAAIGQSGTMLNYRWQRKGLFTSTRFLLMTWGNSHLPGNQHLGQKNGPFTVHC